MDPGAGELIVEGDCEYLRSFLSPLRLGHLGYSGGLIRPPPFLLFLF